MALMNRILRNGTTPTSFVVRDFDCKNFRQISVEERNLAEEKAGNQSAFAECRAVQLTNNGIVQDTGMTVEEFLEFHNS